MTLEGEYYKECAAMPRLKVAVAILMTLEGEYYQKKFTIFFAYLYVAILMTLEGEYYSHQLCSHSKFRCRRNPHDIGRRILLESIIFMRRHFIVAILMTLEGEYYQSSKSLCRSDSASQSS